MCLLSSFYSLEWLCLYNNCMVSALRLQAWWERSEGWEEGGQALSYLIPTPYFRVGPPKSLL